MDKKTNQIPEGSDYLFTHNHSAYQKQTLAANGFKVENLTQSQIDTIMEPLDAPENYMCDGEISQSEAKKRYKRKLIESGINGSDLIRALKLVK